MDKSIVSPFLTHGVVTINRWWPGLVVARWSRSM